MPTAALDPAIAAVLRRPFPEQVAFFRGKLGRLVPTNTWRDLWQAEHDKAFMVAGATKAELLADLAAAIDKAISEGTGIGQFRKDFDATVARHGWDFKGGRNWRTRVIYTTNAATSYAAGRLAQLQASPFWIYKHNDSVLHPRPLHLSWDGLVLPRDHPFWGTHYPPNGWGCKCRVVGVSDPELARKLGGNPDKPLPGNWQQIDPKTGAPVGIDEGWAFAPGASVADDTIRAVAGKVAALPPPLAAALGDTIEDARFASALKRVHAQILASAQGTIEQAALLDASGSLVWIKTGGTRAVSFGSAEVAQMRGGVLTHNHPSSTSLSPADLQMLISGRLSRIYAVGNDGQSLYSARVVAGVSASELKRESARALKSVRAAFFRRIHSGNLAPELAAQMQSHAVNLVLARRGIIRYHARLPGGTPQWVYDLLKKIGP